MLNDQDVYFQFLVLLIVQFKLFYVSVFLFDAFLWVWLVNIEDFLLLVQKNMQMHKGCSILKLLR